MRPKVRMWVGTLLVALLLALALVHTRKGAGAKPDTRSPHILAVLPRLLRIVRTPLQRSPNRGGLGAHARPHHVVVVHVLFGLSSEDETSRHLVLYEQKMSTAAVIWLLPPTHKKGHHHG